MRIRNPQKLIDIISIDDQENTFKTSLDIETLCERIITENDKYMLKNILMPKFVDKHEEALTEFSVGLLTNFDISQPKYQDILLMLSWSKFAEGHRIKSSRSKIQSS